jgi:hypothetical protein
MSKFIQSYYRFLEELTIKNLDRDYGDKTRGDILINKIKSNQEIKKDNGKEVKIDKMKMNGEWVEPEQAINQITTANRYDSDKGFSYFISKVDKNGSPREYRTVFKGDDNIEFTLKQIFKTADLGSKGAGVTSGLSEVMQAIFIAIRLESTEDLTPENISKYYQRYLRNKEKSPIVMADDKYEEIDEETLEKYMRDKNWIETFSKVPNLLLSGNYLDESTTYLVYHTSFKSDNSPYYILKKKYYELAKKGNFKINFNKFCPGDVYLFDFDSTEEFNEKINSVNDISTLDVMCDKFFDAKKLIPISLKMVRSNADYRIIINGEIGAGIPDFYITKFVINDDPHRGIFSKIKTSSIWFDARETVPRNRIINFDSSDTNTFTDIDGEVEGSASRHGKLSLEHLVRLIKKNKGKSQIQTVNQLKKLTVEQLDKVLLDLHTYIKINGGQIIETNKSNKGSKIENSEKKLISKIQSLQVIKSILDIYLKDKKSANLIMTQIMQFALSIKTDYFSTPRYLRVI